MISGSSSVTPTQPSTQPRRRSTTRGDVARKLGDATKSVQAAFSKENAIAEAAKNNSTDIKSLLTPKDARADKKPATPAEEAQKKADDAKKTADDAKIAADGAQK